MKKPIVLVLVMLFVASSAMAREATLTCTKDNGVYAGLQSGGANRGWGGRMDANAAQAGHAASMIQWDLSSLLGPGEYITAASLETFAARNGGSNGLVVVMYPLANSWVEGTGTSGGVVGSTSWGWGDTVAGDHCYDFRVVATTTTGTGSFVAYQVGDTGTAWAGGFGPTGLAVGTDLVNLKMLDQVLSGDSYSVAGDTVFDKALTATGVSVLNRWAGADGYTPLTNNGVSLFPSNNGGYWETRMAQDELGYPAELHLTIVPEPTSLVLLGIGGVLALVRRRK